MLLSLFITSASFPDDLFLTIYAGNYRLRFLVDDINWLFLMKFAASPFFFCLEGRNVG